MLKKKIMAYVHQLLDQPSQWQTSKQAGPCSVPKFTNTSITVKHLLIKKKGGARWLSGRVSDSGARGRGFDTYHRRVVSLSKTLYSPKVLVNYPGSGGSVPT